MSKKMTAEQYLSQAIDIDLRINALNEQLKKLRSGNYGGGFLDEHSIPPQHNGTISNPVQNDVESIAEIELKICEYKNQYTSLKLDIIDRIMKIDIHIYSTLLFERYINGKDWHDVSFDIRKSYDYTKKELHWAALNYFSIKFSEFSP